MSHRIDKENEINELFPISNRAARSIDLQVNSLAKEHLRIGTSKHAAHERIKEENGGKLSAHDRGQGTEFHSWATYHKYRSDFKSFAHYCRSEYGIKKIHDIEPRMVSSFCRELVDIGYSKNSFCSFCSAIEKFGSFMKIDFHPALQEFKKSEDYRSLVAKDVDTRAYSNPETIIAAIKEISALDATVEKVSFSAHLSLIYGLRINDACHFRLSGNRIAFNSKNGMKTIKELTPKDAEKAATLVDARGSYNISTNTASDVWSKACDKAGVENHSWHGLRHNFCQNEYNSLREKGLTHREACIVCSHEMNHSRPGITETYLR